jgi:hypothetical protein
MMTGSAGLHTNQASGKLTKEVQDLLAPQLPGDNDLARNSPFNLRLVGHLIFN